MLSPVTEISPSFLFLALIVTLVCFFFSLLPFRLLKFSQSDKTKACDCACSNYKRFAGGYDSMAITTMTMMMNGGSGGGGGGGQVVNLREAMMVEKFPLRFFNFSNEKVLVAVVAPLSSVLQSATLSEIV
ncbi:hypothetical protein L6452_29989 [Arctium lappa]|uniref:Uncharacterized protein n=1 Tax=Arctium lappa TaxID=4217 RepID=A0ACB8ZHJ6_ARCLA|nr:hypothetical protein L6452_29989 [Arctium lappa]